MRVIVDTNILLRFVIMEDTEQSRIANDLFSAADELVIPTHVLCEMVWVLLSGYKSSREEIQTALAAILKIKKILVREDEAQAGLDMMGKRGGRTA
jgi:predicted nucleic-acid-binding protein